LSGVGSHREDYCRGWKGGQAPRRYDAGCGRGTGKAFLLKALGLHFSINDFGAEFSSLSRLRRSSVDALKIDRGFISSMSDDQDCRGVVRLIVTLA
jgi:EAL domain